MPEQYPKNRVKLAEKLFERYFYKNTPSAIRFMKCIDNMCYSDAANELFLLYQQASNNQCIISNSNLVVRVIASTSDGHIYFDSRKGAPDNSSDANGKNNYPSWKTTPPISGPLNGSITGLAISENHNTRNSFIRANLSEKGKGKETKPALNSNKSPVLESRYAYRYGSAEENFGIIAVSIEEPINC